MEEGLYPRLLAVGLHSPRHSKPGAAADLGASARGWQASSHQLRGLRRPRDPPAQWGSQLHRSTERCVLAARMPGCQRKTHLQPGLQVAAVAPLGAGKQTLLQSWVLVPSACRQVELNQVRRVAAHVVTAAPECPGAY